MDYSTVYVNIEKVSEYDTGIAEELSFGQRLMRSISQGVSNFGGWFEDLVNWLAYNLIQLVVLIVIIVLLAKFHLISKVKGLFVRKPAKALAGQGDAPEKEDK